ncbi:PPC domain-containing protein [Singulisphaera acidiphila]|uniref:Putative pre-peptidase n=1 Tax=Singulisphaera acidiphila (strain ATCC BAA-1392 / DSM 18658 / VKM B-2454 / MOB10) TaxID=886293 RepID=L0DMU0_SINAD|nr:PPC domain-containing protein [Singulisphaera acidiphila]AGA30699.1 putative pre-peptidase [Singulisphaera acidiphila DSM 18658]
MTIPLRSAPLIVLLFGILGAPRPGHAQWPQAKLTGLSRLGSRVGESVDVTLNGTDLEGVHSLWFDHPGIRAFHLKGTTFRVASAPGTPLGHHDIRAVGTYGVTNPRTFVLGDRPETVETEPNNVVSQANIVTLNSVINGQITATDVDVFGFDGKAGQRLLIELTAERLDSRLDATIHILNADGRELAECRDALGVDPFLDLTLPADGRYFIKVHDVVYGGSADHSYRLSLSDGPHLDAILPTVATPGVPTSFTLIGRNLGGTPAPDLLIDGRPIERKTVTITPPASGEIDPLAPSLRFFPSPAAPRRGFEYVLALPSGTSNPLFIAEATEPVVLEAEPNNDDEHAQAVTLPCDISGTFGAPNDSDIYRFSARKGEVWWIEATAERLGSPADPAFLIQQVVAKAPPKDLGSAEDTPDPGGGPRFGVGSVDASLRWTVPEDGTYQVVINDLYASQRGDPRLVYRLNIRPERPDFRLFVVPASTTLVDSLTIAAGGRATAYVLAWRTDGFAGPIHVEAVDLPPGVRCEPVTIATGQVVAPVVFEAEDGAKPRVGTVQLIGRSRFGDRKDELHYVSGATKLGPDLTHQAIAGTMIWPPGNPLTPTMAPARVSRGFVLAVVEAGPLTLAASPQTFIVAQGHQLNVPLTVTRRNAFAEAVTVTAADLPANVVNGTATIAKAEASGTLPLFVAKTVAPGDYTFVVRGTGPFPFSKDPNAKTKPNITLNEPSNAIRLVVRPAPVTLTVNNKGGALKPGGTLEVDLTVARQGGFADDLTVTLTAPPALKLSAAPVTIAASQTTAKFVVQAADDSPVGAAAGVAVRAVATVRGESIEVDEPLVLTLGK